MTEINKIAKENSLKVISDTAQAPGALYFNNAVPVTVGSYTVTVGGGGPGAKNKGDTGNASSFSPSYPAAGGGGGGTGTRPTRTPQHFAHRHHQHFRPGRTAGS